jgi:hypothetical protein
MDRLSNRAKRLLENGVAAKQFRRGVTLAPDLF